MTDKPPRKADQFTYFSYSRLWCYLKDPKEYFNRYVLGVSEPPNEYMVLGTIFARAYAEPSFDWKAALVNPRLADKRAPETITFTSDYARVMEKVLNHPKMFRLDPRLCEQTVKVQGKVCKLQAKHDGRDEKFVKSNVLIIENKYGSCWTEQRANEEDQITFYSYVDWLLTGKIPLVKVQTADRKSGRVESFEVIKTKEQFAPLEDKIEHAYRGIINEVYETI